MPASQGAPVCFGLRPNRTIGRFKLSIVSMSYVGLIGPDTLIVVPELCELWAFLGLQSVKRFRYVCQFGNEWKEQRHDRPGERDARYRIEHVPKREKQTLTRG